MEVHLTPEQEAKVRDIAESTGRSTDEVIQDAVESLIAYENWFREQVRRGLEQADRGEFVSHEEVGRRISRWLRRL